jgi:DNA-directed RNA polymerase subunit L
MDIKKIYYFYTTDLDGIEQKTHYRIEHPNGDESTIRIENASDNRHYEEIQKWVAEGNTIEEAD